jgi:ribonuclease Z
MHITFLGTSSCIPDLGSETASFVINDRHLVDTGWCTALGMRRYGLDPLELESIILTHLHQDHYIGLAQLLFYIGLRGPKGPDTRPLHIIGPGDHLANVVAAAFDFLQLPRFPELDVNYTLTPLSPGESSQLANLHIDTCASRHVSGKGVFEPALAYRVIEPSTGSRFAFSGDTSFHPPLAEFAQGMPLLIHDAAHTPASDAATIAKMAEVGRLLLIHYAQSNAEALLAAARAIFPDSDLAREGDTIAIPTH